MLADVSGLKRSVGFRVPEGGLSCVTGIGARLWGRLFGGPRPAGLHPFTELRGERHTAVSTPADLLFHIRANRLDLCFELAERIMDREVPARPRGMGRAQHRGAGAHHRPHQAARSRAAR